jgi:dsRNA-specific ribonuclease
LEIYPNSEEGILSKLRAALVNEASFTKLANEIKLGKFVYLSPAEVIPPSELHVSFRSTCGGAFYLIKAHSRGVAREDQKQNKHCHCFLHGSHPDHHL